MMYEGWLVHDALENGRSTEMRRRRRRRARGRSRVWPPVLRRLVQLPPWKKPQVFRAPSARDEFYRRLMDRHNLERPNGSLETFHGPMAGRGPTFRNPVQKEPLVAALVTPSGFGVERPFYRRAVQPPADPRLAGNRFSGPG